MKIIRGNSKGFFALSNDTARQISQCIQNKEEWYILWGPETLFYDNSKGPNVWEYYFKQTYPKPEQGVVVEGYTELAPLKDSFRNTMYEIYSKYFLLNDKTISLLQPHIDFFTSNKVLGVHIRRTDKHRLGDYGTTTQQMPVSLDLFKEEINQVIEKYDYIFLATDCSEACNYFNNIYGKKIIFNKNGFRSSGTQSIHADRQDVTGYKKGLDVLSDMILLSNCQHLIRSSSNVSITALYLNPNLTQLNLNQKYYGDCENSIL
jgi:hypothetical protein